MNDGTRNRHQIHPRAARPAGQAERFRPVHHRGISARAEDRRQDRAGIEDRAHAAAHDRDRAQRDERQAGGGVRIDQGVQFRHQPAGHRPVPLQRLRADGPRRDGDADDQHQHPDLRRTEPAARAQGCDDEQARHHDVHRRDRRRQVDVDGRAARLPQREQLRPHHHDRGPDRVRARAQELHHHAARGRGRHRQLGDRAEEHAAAGTRRHPDRRSSRPRHDGLRDRVRRDGPPVPGDAAREQHQPGAGPDHQLLPGRAAPAAADGPCRSTSAPSSHSG